ncbi:MAG: hypothetical protein O3B87_00710 [bacterium]|nr:hypothetical protein [bacterium]
MEQRIINIGNSQGIILSKKILEKIGLTTGNTIVIDVDENNKQVVLRDPDSKPPVTITPQLVKWLEGFNKKNYALLKELAKTP